LSADAGLEREAPVVLVSHLGIFVAA